MTGERSAQARSFKAGISGGIVGSRRHDRRCFNGEVRTTGLSFLYVAAPSCRVERSDAWDAFLCGVGSGR